VGRVARAAPAAVPARLENYHNLTEILHCKWTISILQALAQGVNRPGRLQRALPGLTVKVLNERLSMLVRHGVIVRLAYAEVPPRVEYSFTRRGRRLLVLVRSISEFVEKW
jgi:DNA-binding HxlR family transcriptional regulator